MHLPFENHPVLGFFITMLNFGFGLLLHVKKFFIVSVMLPVLHIHQPPIVAELLQDGAWIAAIASGVFVCYGVYKTHHGKKKEKHDA